MTKRKNANDQMKAWINGIDNMELHALNFTVPSEQTINWNPLEYKVISLDLEKGELKLEKIEKD